MLFQRNKRMHLLRGVNGTVEVIHVRQLMGLFPRTMWLELIATVGFEFLAIPFYTRSLCTYV